MTLRTVNELRSIGPLRIDAIDVSRVAVQMHEPFRISSGEVSRKEATLVRLQNAYAFGWGESSAMPGAFYSADTPESCAQQILELAPTLCGATYANMGQFETFLLGQKLSPFVRVAFETAAWELLARERNLPMRALFGLADGPAKSGLAVGLYPTLEELHAALERYDVRKYKRLKIKIKRGQDIELVRAIRSWYGNIPLFVDANADYTANDFQVFRELDSLGLMMFEQPFLRSDLKTSAMLQRISKTPICFDEGIESVSDVYEAASADACRIVNVKLQRVGGYLEALRIGEACLQTGLPLWMGTMPELGIGSAQALVFASHPANQFPTDVEESARWYIEDILQPELRVVNGTLSLPEGPGLGFEVDLAKLEKYTTSSRSFRS